MSKKQQLPLSSGDIVIPPESSGDGVTAGKEYKVLSAMRTLTPGNCCFEFEDDFGVKRWASMRHSHLCNLKDWIIKKK
jgi:hypothetical protein